ncbi:NADP-binding protein [Dacryopinax primogenitus]|uniref:NADP-binding protein n=1 Tax=Dacryopinax primogenitus (strain DJM 731) TaxID=1858805 RepID=M5GCB2_DACPD|nr:NADP-binding protein [Dacryopinax primogenitus]EJU03772.1 NADP-binding protein [Dacryopinax primogenitus]
MSATNTPVVFVDGANGFIGTTVILEALKQGYHVKAAVRRQESADAFGKKYPEHGSKIDWVFIPDFSDQEAVAAALKGVTYVMHVASPFRFDFTDNEKEVLIPARENTLSILRAAAKNPEVKRVVITSSFAAVCDLLKGMWPEKTYSEQDWNPATWNEAVRSDIPPFVYCASKGFAERAAWEYMDQEKPGFALTTFCPPMVFGPPQQPIKSMKSLNESVDQLWRLFSGTEKEVPFTNFPGFIDVRDLAHLHLASLTNDKARDKRYLVVGGHYSFDEAVVVAREAFPNQAARMTPSTGKPAPEHYKLDVSKAEADFDIKWTPFKKTIVDTAEVLFKTEALLASA